MIIQGTTLKGVVISGTFVPSDILIEDLMLGTGVEDLEIETGSEDLMGET